MNDSEGRGMEEEGGVRGVREKEEEGVWEGGASGQGRADHVRAKDQ